MLIPTYIIFLNFNSVLVATGKKILVVTKSKLLFV